MEHVTATAKKGLALLIESGELPASDSERSAQVWNALTEMYGNAFVSSYGEQPTRIWAEAISSLNDRELQRGFKRLVEEVRTFPPNVSEFVHACKQTAPVRFLGIPQSPEQARLGHNRQRASPETIKKHLANMRKALQH